MGPPLYNDILTALDQSFNKHKPVLESVDVSETWYYYKAGFLISLWNWNSDYIATNSWLESYGNSSLATAPKMMKKADTYTFKFDYVHTKTHETDNKIKFKKMNEVTESVTVNIGVEIKFLTLNTSGTGSKTSQDAFEIECPKARIHYYDVFASGSGTLSWLSNNKLVGESWVVPRSKVGTLSIYDDDDQAAPNVK